MIPAILGIAAVFMILLRLTAAKRETDIELTNNKAKRVPKPKPINESDSD